MTTITAMESAPDIEPGIYPATLAGYEEAEANQFGPGVKLIWEIDGKTKDDGTAYEKWQFCSQKLTPKSNLWLTLTALGFPPTLGVRYELESLMENVRGRKAVLTIKHVDNKAGGIAARVTDVNALAGAQSAPATASTLAEKLGTVAAPAGTAEANQCGVKGCTSQYTRFTAGGTPLCDAHTAEDL